MPRVPIITSGSQAVVVPAPRVYGVDTGGTLVAQHGLNTLSQSLSDIAVQIKAQKADNEITAVDSVYKARVKLAQETLLSNPDIEDYTQAFIDQEALLYQDAASKLTMDSTRRAFEKLRNKTLPGEVANVGIAELKLSAMKEGAKTKTSIGLLSNEAAQTVTTADRNAIDEEVKTRLERSVARRFMTPAEAETELKKHHERVDSAWATRRATTDPLGTAEDLQAGLYKGIPQDRAERLAFVLTERARRDQEQQIRKSEHEQNVFNKWFNEQKAQKETELTIAAGNGSLSLQTLDQDARDWGIHPERYQAIKNVLDKPDRKEQSDPDTLTAVSIDSNSGRPRMSLSQLAKLRESGLLNQADFDRESQKRLSLEREDRALAKGEASLDRIQRNYDYTRAKELLQASLGIPTMWEKLDPVTKKLWASALTELDTRAGAVNGKEQASTVAYELIKKYSAQMDQSARLNADQIVSTLRFKSWAELEANKGNISTAEYNNQSHLLTQLDQLRKAAEARAAAKASEQPKPGGILDWLWPKPKENQPGSPNRRPQ